MLTLLILLALAFSGFAALLIVCISIVEAPWPVLLGVLVVGLFAIQWLALQGGAIAQSPVADAESYSISEKKSERKQKPMNRVVPEEDSAGESSFDQERIYRGIHYQGKQPADQPKHAATEQTVEGVYRGQQWHRDRPLAPPPTDSLPEIVYRGQKVFHRPSDSE